MVEIDLGFSTPQIDIRHTWEHHVYAVARARLYDVHLVIVIVNGQIVRHLFDYFDRELRKVGNPEIALHEEGLNRVAWICPNRSHYFVKEPWINLNQTVEILIRKCENCGIIPGYHWVGRQIPQDYLHVSVHLANYDIIDK